MIPLSVPCLGGNAQAYLNECVETGWVSSAGPFVTRFEQLVAQESGRRFAVATVNGTAALHLSLLAAGVMPEDEVLVPALTFIATANAVRYCGAWPVLMDVDPTTWTLDVGKAGEFFDQKTTIRNGRCVNRDTGRRIAALLPVHLLGHAADMAPLGELAERYGLALIADAAAAMGSSYRGSPIGIHGDAACFSFNGNKIVTAGGGGMVVTDREDWAHQIRHLSTQARLPGREYVHDRVGYNYRLTNLQAALGCSQMEQLAAFVGRKGAIAEEYRLAFQPVPGLVCPVQADWTQYTFWLYTIAIDNPYPLAAGKLVEFLEEKGIESRRLWQPIHMQAAYQRCQTYRIEQAVRIYEHAVSLPSSVGLTSEDQTKVIASVLAPTLSKKSRNC